jgi:hypothetical protein
MNARMTGPDGAGGAWGGALLPQASLIPEKEGLGSLTSCARRTGRVSRGTGGAIDGGSGTGAGARGGPIGVGWETDNTRARGSEPSELPRMLRLRVKPSSS